MYKIPNRDFPWICCKVEKLENITLIFSSFGWGKNMWWIIITFMSITEGLPFNITPAKETNQLEEGLQVCDNVTTYLEEEAAW